jgi:hypothetical protein
VYAWTDRNQLCMLEIRIFSIILVYTADLNFTVVKDFILQPLCLWQDISSCMSSAVAPQPPFPLAYTNTAVSLRAAQYEATQWEKQIRDGQDKKKTSPSGWKMKWSCKNVLVGTDSTNICQTLQIDSSESWSWTRPKMAPQHLNACQNGIHCVYCVPDWNIARFLITIGMRALFFLWKRAHQILLRCSFFYKQNYFKIS